MFCLNGIENEMLPKLFLKICINIYISLWKITHINTRGRYSSAIIGFNGKETLKREQDVREEKKLWERDKERQTHRKGKRLENERPDERGLFTGRK